MKVLKCRLLSRQSDLRAISSCKLKLLFMKFFFYAHAVEAQSTLTPVLYICVF